MFALFEGWFWCFFLEKKDILRDLEPKNGGMAGGGGDCRGGGGRTIGSAGYCRTGGGLDASGRWGSGGKFRLTQSRLTGRHRS